MQTGPAIVVAIGVLLGSWSLAHHLAAPHKLLVDTPVYERYGDAVVQGKVPYRDFKPEYPPLSLPTFVLPSLVAGRHHKAEYGVWFDREMAVCAVLVLLGVALITTRPTALGLVAVAPVLLGPVVLSRFDYWPTALAVLALAAYLRKRLTTAAVLLGAAIGAKLWPAAIAPVLFLHLWRTRGPRVAALFAGGVVAVTAAIFLPFAIIAPEGIRYSLHRQFGRPIQIESLGGAVLIWIHRFFHTTINVKSSFGSQNIDGFGYHAMTIATTVLMLVALVIVWWTARGVVAGCAAAVAAFLAFGKVFSPQFMIWLVAFVPLVPGTAIAVLFVAALLLTQAWFPRHYWDLTNSLALRESGEVLLRDLVVVALLVLLTLRARRPDPAPLPASAGGAAVEPPAERAPRAA
jgi:Glycosyltransferase family 87